ncbi:D-alanyl-D-alanine carboxypeptidase [Silvimonas terrae]|uniref:D-alanyl-D-alanine carboxypeptidase n=1 Tax=Silvimonas terrae TaxID=300266 RepID=A0A840RHB0_9NEIS|nr:M15 family metallopeptidase [Silvimonas terrae]MBB5191964.1 D-alanyl-D-alanine carboxypeptidase [Silvimonas terrae]
MTTQPTPALLALWSSLGIQPGWITARGLPLFADADELVAVQGFYPERTFRLTPAAAQAWTGLHAAATADGIDLVLISAWRGIERQVELIRSRLAQGEDIQRILQRLAPPGCSEHHTGRAVDVATPQTTTLDASFADTAAYAWLQQSAARFGFTQSFPQDNVYGYTWEPWHWCYQPELIASLQD